MLLLDTSFLIEFEDELVHGKVGPAHGVLAGNRRQAAAIRPTWSAERGSVAEPTASEISTPTHAAYFFKRLCLSVTYI